MQVQVAKDSSEWNAIVDKSPFSVLHHRYEAWAYKDNALPLVIRVGNYRFLFPLETRELLRSFRLSSSPIYYYATILPEAEEAIDMLPSALDSTLQFLRKMRVDYLSTCAPTFLSRKSAITMNSWFRKHNASVQVIYVHLIELGGMTFADVWKNRFSKHARNQVRKAGKEGVNVVKINVEKELGEWMEDIYQCNLSALKRQGRIGAYPDSYKEVLRSELLSTKNHLKENFNIYGAVYRDRLIAYMITREYNGLMHINKAMSHTQFLRKRPNDALIGYLVKEACNQGFKWFEYGFDRVKWRGQVPSLYSTLQEFKFKFGFEEVPVPIFRLGISCKGSILQSLFAGREFLTVNSARMPNFVRELFYSLYAPKHRRFFGFLHA